MTGAVCVIGGTSGIGAAVAARLAADARPVTVVGRHAASGEIGADFVAADATDRRQLDHLLTQVTDRHGTPVGLVVSGGGTDLVARPAAQTASEDLHEMFAAHYTGRLLPVLTFAPAMARAGYGKIVVISTVAALAPTRQQWLAASVAAGAQHACRSLAAEFAPAGVRLNVVALTLVQDSGFDRRRRDGRLDPAVSSMIAKAAGRLPLGPPGLDDVVATVLHLLGPESDGITGAVVPLSGGLVF